MRNWARETHLHLCSFPQWAILSVAASLALQEGCTVIYYGIHADDGSGSAYLVTKEQYLHVKKREGDWYQHEVRLDDIEGIPAYTFTSDIRHPFVMPSDNYRKVIKDGLIECGLHLDAAKTYLDTYIKMARAGEN